MFWFKLVPLLSHVISYNGELSTNKADTPLGIVPLCSNLHIKNPAWIIFPSADIVYGSKYLDWAWDFEFIDHRLLFHVGGSLMFPED